MNAREASGAQRCECIENQHVVVAAVVAGAVRVVIACAAVALFGDVATRAVGRQVPSVLPGAVLAASLGRLAGSVAAVEGQVWSLSCFKVSFKENVNSNLVCLCVTSSMPTKGFSS